MKIGDGAEIRHGAHVSEDAKVCAGAGCSKHVPVLLLFLRIESPWTRSYVVRMRRGKDAYPLPLLTFLGADAAGPFYMCAAGSQFVTEGASYLTKATRGLWFICIRGSFVARHLRALRARTHPENAATETGKGESFSYALSRFFVSAHETRVFWRKLFIASCEAPFSFTPLCNLCLAVGRRDRWSERSRPQELHGAVDAPELVSIGDDCYLGAHVTLRPLKVEGSSVKAVGVAIGTVLRGPEHLAPEFL